MITLDTLPEEIKYKILGYCDLATVNSVSLVSKRLRSASRDNLLWQLFCQPDLKTISFHPSARKVPKDGYRAEYIYQRQIDKLVDDCIQSIVHDPATRFENILILTRIGLRCRIKLLEICRHKDYDVYNLRHRYYASELLQAISYQQATVDVLGMFNSDKPFDSFQFYLAFDAFQHGKKPDHGPSSEETYADELVQIQQILMPIKDAFQESSHRQMASRSKENPVQTAAELLGLRLYDMSLILDIQDQPHNGHFRSQLGEFYLREVFENSYLVNGIPMFNTPCCALLRAAIYVHFAKWIGLNASIVVLEFDTYVRIEDPRRADAQSSNPDKAKGCFFADLNRAGKIREVDEMLELIKLARSSKRSLSPSSHQNIIEMFSHECISFLNSRTNQFEDKADCISFLGGMICSFLCAASQRQFALGLPIPISPVDSSTRLDLTNLSFRTSVHSIVEHSTKLSIKAQLKAESIALKTNTDQYNEDRLTHRYSMVIPAITFQVPCAAALVSDFLFPLAPTDISQEDKYKTIQSIIDMLILKDRVTKGIPTYPDSPVAEFYPGDLIFHERSNQYGVIINSWLNEPSPRGDGEIQHTAYMQGGHHLTVRETSVRRPGYGMNFDRLLRIDRSFFGTEIGLYCSQFKMLPDCTSSFVLTPELQPKFSTPELLPAYARRGR